MFIRRAPVEAVADAFGMDLGRALLLPAVRATEALSQPVLDDAYEAVRPWIRMGLIGEWAFAIDSCGIDIAEVQAAERRLSAGTSVATYAWNPKIDEFRYWENGQKVTSFEPGRWSDRHGSDPDRFLPQMREIGLFTVDPSAAVQEPPTPVITILEILTIAFGIQIPVEIAFGPLLTVQRR